VNPSTFADVIEVAGNFPRRRSSMRKISGVIATLGAVAAIAATTAMTTGHDGSGPEGTSHDGNGRTFDQALVGLPATQKIAIDGVPAAGAPWTVRTSSVSISDRGDLRLDARGLLITGTGGPNDGTVGPVKQVVASLMCANGSSATTSPSPLSASGDARIRDRITTPPDCLAPVVLVRIFGIDPANPWIAATGL
jgi:hypothetical protein